MASDGMLFCHSEDGPQVGFVQLAAGAIVDAHVWCPHCLTSAALTVEILALTDSGFKVLTTPTWCERCRVFLTKRKDQP